MYRTLIAVWLSGFLKFVPLCFSVSPFSLRFTPLICDSRPLIRVSTPLIYVPVPEISVAHRPMGERPPPHGRAPIAPWASAHRPVGERPSHRGRAPIAPWAMTMNGSGTETGVGEMAGTGRNGRWLGGKFHARPVGLFPIGFYSPPNRLKFLIPKT